MRSLRLLLVHHPGRFGSLQTAFRTCLYQKKSLNSCSGSFEVCSTVMNCLHTKAVHALWRCISMKNCYCASTFPAIIGKVSQ